MLLFKVNRLGIVCEVDLDKYRQKDNRPAKGLGSGYICFPHEIDNNINKFKVAFSDIQWSWNRIKFFEKSNKKNIRLETLDFTPFIKKDCRVNYTYSKNSNGLVNIRLFQKSMIPTILLNDPLRILTRLQDDLTETWKEFLKTVKKVVTHPYFKSAQLAYQLFFNPKLAYNRNLTEQEYEEYYKNGGYLNGFPLQKKAATQPTSFKQAAAYLNRSKLEKILQIKERKAIKTRIRMLQQALIAYMDSKQAIAALTDYFAATKENYANGFIAVAGLTNNICTNPDTIDRGLDLPIYRNQQKSSPGKKYIVALFNNDHPLHAKIFPSKDNNQATTMGSGNFQLDDFAALFTTTGKSINKAITMFIENVAKSTTDIDTKTTNSLINNIHGLISATKIPALNEIKTVSTQNISADYEMMGYNHNEIAQFLRRNSRLTNIYKPGAGINNVTISHLQVHVAKDGSFSASETHTKTPAQHLLSNEEFAKQIQMNLKKQGEIVIATPKSEGKFLNRLIYTDKTVTSICFALQLLNLSIAIGNIKQERKGQKQYLHTTAETLFTIYAIENLTRSFCLSHLHLTNFQKKTIFRTIKLAPLSLAGITACLISAALSISEIRDSYISHDTMALIGNTINSAGFIIDAAAILSETIDAATLSALSIFDTLGWAALATILLGTLIVALYSDTKLIRWAKNSPYSTVINQNISNDDAYISLLDLIINLKIELQTFTTHKNSTNICAEIQLPYFNIAQHSLEVILTRKDQMQGTSSSPEPDYLLSFDSIRLTPSSITQLIDTTNSRTVGFRYHYQDSFADITNIPNRTIYFSYAAKVRLVFNQIKRKTKWFYSNTTSIDPTK